MTARPASTWRETLFASKSLTLALALTLAVSAGLFLHRTSGAWENPRQSVIRGSDDWCYFLWLPSVLGEGDVDFSNQFKAVPNWDEWVRDEFLAAAPTPTGLLPNKYPVGWAMLGAPWYLASQALSPEDETARTLPSPWVEWWVLVGQWFYGLAGLGAGMMFLAHFFEKKVALSAVLAGWWCSPLLYYQTCALSMSHSAIFGLVAVIFLATERLRNRSNAWVWWCGLGAAAGLLLATRPSAMPYVLYPAVRLVPMIVRERRWISAVLTAVVSLAVFSPQLGAWRALYGRWVADSYAGEGFAWSQPKFFEVLFSPWHGWLYWHVALAIGLAGLALASRSGDRGQRRAAIVLGMIVIIVTWLNASWESWWYGVSFGARAFEGATLAVMFGFGWWWTRLGSSGRATTLMICVVAGMWNLNLVWLARHWRQSGLSLADPVTYMQMVKSTRTFYFSPDAPDKPPGSPRS